MRTSSRTSAGRRGLARRCTPLDRPPPGLAAHPTEEYGHWMKSSTPSVCTTRTCVTPCGTAETSNIPLGTVDPSSHYHFPRHEESLASPGSLSSRKRGGVELSCLLTGRSTLSSEVMGHKKAKGNKSSTTGRSWWPSQVPQLLTGGQSTR
jgi:hypothetical protein